MKKFFEEFKTFAMRGNVIDMAVGVVIGGAFGKISTSIVNDIIMPVVSMITGGIDFTAWKIVLKQAVMEAGADGVLAGVTTYDAMLPNINNELPGYENDPVIVSAMREACHHNLYALVNSSAMNGITANSVIIAHELPLVKNVKTFSLVIGIAFVVFTALWIWGTTKLKKTEAYTAYMEMKKQKKAK